MVAALVFDVIVGSVIEKNETADLFTVTYSLMGEGTSDLTFCSHLVTHEWPLRVFTVDGPVLPSVENGTIDVLDFDNVAGCVPPDNSTEEDDTCVVDEGSEYSFTVLDANGIVGSDVRVPVDLQIEGTCVESWQFGICIDVDDLTYESAERGAGLDDVYLLFFGVVSEEPGNIAFVCVLDVLLEEVLLESDDPYEITVVRFSIDEDFGSSEVSLCEPELLNGPGRIGINARDGELDGEAYNDGTVYTTAGFVGIVPELPFERGDVDGDGVIFPILDAISLLEWFFNSGPAPPCMDAADVDDSGDVAGLLDASYLLTYGFVSGEAPPDPFADCDNDPTDDVLGCSEDSAGCD